LGVFLALVEGLLFLNFRDTLTRSADERLRSALSSVVQALSHPEREGGDDHEWAEVLNNPAFQSQEIGIALFDRAGRRRYGSLLAEGMAYIPNVRQETWQIQGEKEETARRVMAVPAQGWTVEASIPWDPTEDSLERLAALLVTLFAAFLSLAGLGGWLLVGAALRPIEDISETARRIHADNLSERLPDHASDREIRGLVATLNAMMERLAGAFESQRRFTADASHELRTPVTIIQNEVEVALTRPRSDGEYRQILAGILEETKRMTRLINDLLFLARNDALPEALDTVEAPLDDLCRLVAEEFRSLADAKGLRLQASVRAEGLSVSGDPERLRWLLENLVDNALKYAASPGEVRLSLDAHENGALIAVEDTGPGIEKEHLPRLFERFYRVDKSRSRALGGSGLGLSISQQIARLHGGTLRVESDFGKGTRFLLWLPGAYRSPDAAQNKAISDRPNENYRSKG
jgi:heavy metal sensor kinase